MKIIKFFAVSVFALGSLFLSSCGCCTNEAPNPPLRRVPKMQELPGADVEAPTNMDAEAPEKMDAEAPTNIPDEK